MGKIEDILGIGMHPVAIYREAEMPSDASVPSAHCNIPSLFVKCARTGKKCAADKDHIFCHGAVSGFGFGGIPDRQRTAMRLSAIPPECNGEFKHEAKDRPIKISLVHSNIDLNVHRIAQANVGSPRDL